MKEKNEIILSCLFLMTGIILVISGFGNVVDSYWSGMGGGLTVVSLIRLLRLNKVKKNKEYREKKEVEEKDERNVFLRRLAWEYGGFSFIVIAALSSVILKIAGQNILSFAAGISVCLLTFLYWVSYLVLRKKY